MIDRILFTKEGRKFYIRDASKDFHSEFGFFSAADISKGGAIKSNKGTEAYVINSSFIDEYERIRRSPQIIPLKDIGSIVAYAGIGKKSTVVDAGTGSGALAIFLANICKKITSYEIRTDFYEIAKHNIAELGIKNLTIKNKDVCAGIDEKNVDLITLDMPSPWEAISSIKKALKKGGFAISYSPTIPQVSDFVEAARKSEIFSGIRTIEVIERDWEVTERKIRPKSQQIGHSGFLTFARRIL
ncbi:tRNA (adenine-N1)-methyltransferase [Candidatus Woesearchaeota archaeon]|nr:tRNA (adenine-N1)-methyltransferase [Candidatus Woesearchaeota archaeon]